MRRLGYLRQELDLLQQDLALPQRLRNLLLLCLAADLLVLIQCPFLFVPLGQGLLFLGAGLALAAGGAQEGGGLFLGAEGLLGLPLEFVEGGAVELALVQEEVLVELGLAAEEVVADAAFGLNGVDGRDFLADHFFHFLVRGTHHYV